MGFAEHFGQVQFDHPKSLMAVSSRVPQAASMHSSILFESPNIKDHLQLISKNIGLLLIQFQITPDLHSTYSANVSKRRDLVIVHIWTSSG